MQTSKPSPIDIANLRISEARAAAQAHLGALRYTRSQFEKTGFVPEPGCGPAKFATDQLAWDTKRSALRSAESNFSPSAFAQDQLDNAPDAKKVLEDLLAHLRTKRALFEKHRPSLVSRLASACQPADSDEKPCREPVRGIFGRDELPPLEIDFQRIEGAVALFPNGRTFAGVVSMGNLLNNRLVLPDPKAVPPKRQDKAFIVRELPPLPQPMYLTRPVAT